MKNSYFFRLVTRHLSGWLSLVLLSSLVPTALLAQTSLSAGDIAFVGFNGVDDGANGNKSTDKFAFVLLKDVAAGTKIFFTDFGWLTGGGFQSVTAGANIGAKDDGIISWTASTSLAAGTQVVILCKYNLSATTGAVAGVENVPGKTYYMNIGDPGADNIFAYQGTSARDANPTLLAGIRTAGRASIWDASLTNNEFTSSKTTLPASLTANGINAALYLKGSFYTIAIYKCTLNNAFPKALRNAINNPANWEYPNPGTLCEGYIYEPNNPECPQSSIPTGYDLPINCSVTVNQVQIVSQPVNRIVCAGQPASFNSTAQNATAYQWQVSTTGGVPFSNLSNTGVYSGVTSTMLTISNTTGLNGYRYRLIASESTEPSSATSSAALLTVNDGPQNLNLTPDGPLSCTAPTITLTATSTGGTSYVFSGPGIVNQSGNTATVNQSGTYTVIATSSGNCTASTTTTVSANLTSPQNVSLLASGTLSCTATTVTLTGSSSGDGNNYVFSGPGVVSQSENTAVVNTAGVYSVTVTNTTSGCFSTTSVSISQDTSTPVATLSASPSITLTYAQTSLTLTAGGGNSYVFGGPGVVSQSENTAVVNTAGVYSVTVINTTNGCLSMTSINIISSPMPVDLVSFKGTWVKDKGSELSWVTSWEENNKYFDVQSSPDAKSFERIGRVEGSGTASSLQTYTYVDAQPIADLTYYRLKQVDTDGKFVYSMIIGVRKEIVDKSLRVYPNPASDLLNLRLNEQTIIETNLYDQQGQLVLHQTDGSSQLKLTSLQSGVYMVEVKTETGVIYRQRLIKHQAN